MAASIELGSMVMSKAVRNLFLVVFAVRILCAWKSEGFYQFDEHFQVIEFIGKIRGITPAENLPWEYHQKIRPWFQPMSLLGAWRLIDPFEVLKTPHHQAFFFRLLSGFLGLLSSTLLLLAAVHANVIRIPALATLLPRDLKEKVLLWGIGFSSLLWVFPFFQVRTSAESWSSSWFWLGVATSLLCEERQSLFKKAGMHFLAGALFGLAFLSKYQAGLLIAGWGVATLLPSSSAPLTAWRDRLLKVTTAAAACILCILAGTALDRIGYGEWQLTAWNYLNTNLIEGVAFRFSPQPWWWYLQQSLLWAAPLTSVLLILTLQSAFRTKDLRITLPIFIYLAFHFWMSNKELRFLFPVLPGVIILVLNSEWTWRLIEEKKPVWRGFRRLLLAENFILLTAVCWFPASSAMPTYRAIYTAAFENETLFTVADRPFGLLDLEVKFYQPPGLRQIRLKEWSELILASKNLDHFLVLNAGWTQPDTLLALQGVQCDLVYQSHPSWLRTFNPGNWQARSRVRNLALCIAKKSDLNQSL